MHGLVEYTRDKPVSPGMAYVYRCGYSGDEAVTAVEGVAHVSTQYLLRYAAGTELAKRDNGPFISKKKGGQRSVLSHWRCCVAPDQPTMSSVTTIEKTSPGRQ